MLRRIGLILLTLTVFSGCSSPNTANTTTETTSETSAESASVQSEESRRALFKKYLDDTQVTETIKKAADAWENFGKYQNEGDNDASDAAYNEAEKYVDEIMNLPPAPEDLEPFQKLYQKAGQLLVDSMDQYIQIRTLSHEEALKARDEGDRLWHQCEDTLSLAAEWEKAYIAGDPFDVEEESANLEEESKDYVQVKEAYQQYQKDNSKQEAAFFNLEFQATLLDQRMSEEPIIESQLTSPIDLIISANETFSQEKSYDPLMEEYVQWQLKAVQSWLLEAKAALLVLEKAAEEHEMLTPSSFTQARDYFSQSKEYTDKLEAFRNKYND